MTTMPTIRGKLGSSNGGTSTLVVNVPTDSTAPVVGDLMTVAIVFVSATSIPSPPSGWSVVLAPAAMGTRYLSVYQHVRASGDPNSVTFTMNTTGTAMGYLFYGAGKAGAVGTYLRTSTGNVQTTPGVTTTVANSLVVSIQGEATAATETYDKISVDAPFVKDGWYIHTSSPINSVLLAHREMATPGASGDAVSTWLKDDGTANSSGNRGSIMIVIEPVPDTVQPITKLAAKMSDGNGNAINVGLTGVESDGAGGVKEFSLSKLELVHSGTFVPDLDRTSRVWTMAHRGGSVDYQEHSKQGYVQCAIAHVDVMEFSVGVSSDGVFFGLHDSTLNRTSSSLGSVDTNPVKAVDRTWAQIQALVQDLPNRGDSRFSTAPYMSLEDFITQWSPSHTLMFDPKVLSTAQRTNLYNRIKQIPDYQNRVLGKFYTTGTAIADEFHAIGCKVWGYSYTADVGAFDGNGNFVVRTNSGSTYADAAKWDYLGLEWNADPKVWAAILQIAGPKKVIAHICPTVTAAQTGVANGAKALQVSGVNAVSAVY